MRVLQWPLPRFMVMITPQPYVYESLYIGAIFVIRGWGVVNMEKGLNTHSHKDDDLL